MKISHWYISILYTYHYHLENSQTIQTRVWQTTLAFLKYLFFCGEQVHNENLFRVNII